MTAPKAGSTGKAGSSSSSSKPKAPPKPKPAAKPVDHYCPGCGSHVDALPGKAGECTGTAEAPHQPIAYVDAAELDKGPEHHTPAPASE